MVSFQLFVQLATVAVSSVSASCAAGTSHQPRSLGHVHVAEFDYTGLTGPLNWYGMDAEKNKLCATGDHQSPISINSTEVPFFKGDIHMDIPDTDSARLENIGDVLQVVTDGTLTLDGDEYKLAQFHFHTPSEHRLDLEYSPMECHWVFENSNKEVAVATYFFELSDSDPTPPLFEAVFANIAGAAIPGDYTATPPLKFEDVVEHFMINEVYTYSGSLTTPPCTEGVKWLISKEPLPLDVKTFNTVKKVLKFNSRVTQNYPGKTNLLSYEATELNGK